MNLPVFLNSLRASLISWACAQPELMLPELILIPLILSLNLALWMLPRILSIPVSPGPISEKVSSGLKAGPRSTIEVFRSRFKTLFSLIQVLSVFSKLTEVAMAAIPIKKNRATNPMATKVPKKEAKKLLKNFMSSYFVSNIGFVELFYEI